MSKMAYELFTLLPLLMFVGKSAQLWFFKYYVEKNVYVKDGSRPKFLPAVRQVCRRKIFSQN